MFLPVSSIRFSLHKGRLRLNRPADELLELGQRGRVVARVVDAAVRRRVRHLLRLHIVPEPLVGSQLGERRLRRERPEQESAMTAEHKSPLEQVNDVVSQLKEMRHYAKNNVERLTAQWMLFDGELKKLHHTDRIEELFLISFVKEGDKWLIWPEMKDRPIITPLDGAKKEDGEKKSK